MNVGGPAHHVALLSGRLSPERYDTLLATGAPGPGEASAEHLAGRHGARLVRVPALGPEPHPVRDLRALGALVRLVRRFEPDLVHTHTAKAGALGRLAVELAGRPRPVVVHTFHGHVLRGYFGPRTTAAYRGAERVLARRTDRLVGVSHSVVDDLVALGVAPPERFSVVALGLDLGPFLAVPPDPGGPARRALGVTPEETLAVFAGRLVAVKRVDVLLEAVVAARRSGAPVRLAVAGDGPLRAALEDRAAALGLAQVVTFLGVRDDLPELVRAADVAVLSSAQEGTPVALIEAAAGARPAVATDVGGVADIVTGDTGRLVPAGDPAAFGAALLDLAADPASRRRMGTAAREHVRDAFAAGRLLADVDALYRDLLSGRPA